MQAVIFDFDGLILDTESPAFEAWTEIYRAYGQELPLTEWVKCVGASDAHFDPVIYLESLLERPLDRVELFAKKDQRKTDIVDTLAPLPGVIARLDEARALGLRLAVASSSSARWVNGHLARLSLADRFDAVRTKDDVSRVKPHPDLYLAAAKALDVAPSACLVFEDSLNGVRAARAAGMRVVAVPGPITRGLDFREADAVAASLADVSLARWLACASPG